MELIQRSEQAFFRWQRANPPRRKLRKVRKKHQHVSEKIKGQEFKNWFEEEVVRFQRTQEATENLWRGVYKIAEKAVCYRCENFGLEAYFRDVLQDVVIRLIERALFNWNPLRGSAYSFVFYHSYFLAGKEVVKYLPEGVAQELLPDDMLDDWEIWKIEDFTQQVVPAIRWRYTSELCNYLVMLILVGVQRKTIISTLRRSFFKGKKERKAALAIYYYVLVTLRLELSKFLETYEMVGDSSRALERFPDSGIPSSLWNGSYQKAD